MSTNNTTPDTIWLYPESGNSDAGEWFWTNALEDHDPDDVQGAIKYVRADTRSALQGQAVTEAMGHDEAINALISCAQTVTVLSYREVVEGYLKLRNVDQATLSTQEQASGESPMDRLQRLGQECNAATPQDAAGDLVERLYLPWTADPDEREGMEWNWHIYDAKGDRVAFMANGPDHEPKVKHIVNSANAALRSQSGLVEAVEPFKDFVGDLPEWDDPLRCVYESGIQYAVDLLAKTLGVDHYSPCEGTEDFDGDLGGTMFNILLEVMPKDADGDPMHPKEVREALSTIQESRNVEG